VCVRAGATIIAIISRPSVPHHATRHLPVEGVAAQATYDEALQQPSRPPSPFALAATVFIELQLSGLEHAYLYDGRHRDGDPLLSWHRR